MSDEIVYPLKQLLGQLQQLLSDLDDGSYQSSIGVLSDASIGQHTRHVIESFIELDHGYDTGYVNYDLRKRNKQIEDDRDFALATLKWIIDGIGKEDKPLWLVTDLNPEANTSYRVATNYARELVYNLEHVVHHMALMRIGVQAVCHLKLPDTFGVACSTVRHRRLKEQNFENRTMSIS
jgi:hypothetical protein